MHRGRVFDVQPSTDDRALAHPVSAVLPDEEPPPFRRTWRPGPILDQAAEGACVGHGWTADLTGSPVRVRFGSQVLDERAPGVPHEPQAFAFWLYHEAQRVDPWPGEDYSGTSIEAAAGIVQRLGFIESYRWAETLDDFVSTLQQIGPVVIAIPWYDGMYSAPDGRLVVSGEQVGWHCLLANGYDPEREPLPGDTEREMVRLQNSWGVDWGVEGQAWMDLDDLWALLSTDGAEMCVPLARQFAHRTSVAQEGL